MYQPIGPILRTMVLSGFGACCSQEDADAADGLGAPAAATYESHSGGIVETLTDLLEKADEQLDDTRKKETQDTTGALVGPGA